MLSDFSWSNYTVVVTILLVIYYLFIGLRFYIHELRSIFLRGQVQLGVLQNQELDVIRTHDAPLHEPSQEPFMEDSNGSSPQLENLINKLKGAIEAGIDMQLSKHDILKNMQLVLRKHSPLKSPTFKAAINELIISECEKYGFTMLDEDEIVVLWDSDQ